MMLSKLIRFSPIISCQVIAYREITNRVSKRVIPLIYNGNVKSPFALNSISGIRSLSDQKLEKNQIDEKILDIIRNFDRVKENPANPQVKTN